MLTFTSSSAPSSSSVPSGFFLEKQQQTERKSGTTARLLFFFTSLNPSLLPSFLHHSLFVLVVSVPSCQVVHSDGQEDVQQDV